MIGRNSRGFTLIEIVIAIGIMTGLAFMMSVTMTNMIAGKMRSEEYGAIQHSVQVGLARLFDDFSMAFLADASFAGREKSFTTGFQGEANRVDFSTMSNLHYVKNNKDTFSVDVGYFLRSNKDGMQDLMRRQSDYLEEDVKRGGKAFPLIPNVKSVVFDYYDANSKDWRATWNSDSVTSSGGMPAQVRVKLEIYGGYVDEEETERREYSYEIVVPIYNYKARIAF